MSRSPSVDLEAAEGFADELLMHFGWDDLDDDFDLDLDEEDEEESFGSSGSASWPSRVLEAEEQRFGLFKKLGQSTSSVVSSAGEGFLSTFNPWLKTPVAEPVAAPPPQQVVADRQTLPPVYVADPSLAARATASPSVASPAVMIPTSKFGASYVHGSEKQRDLEGRSAAVRARLQGSSELRSSPVGDPVPMVEDATAHPVMTKDGEVVEPIHGRLVMVSCFSCCRKPVSYGSSGNGCVVCDDYGAILVPSSDLSSVAGTESFGFIAALLGGLAPLASKGAQSAGTAVSDAKLEKQRQATERAAKVYERLKHQVEVEHAPTSIPTLPVEAPSVVPESAPTASSYFGFDDADDDGFDEDDLNDLFEEDEEDESFGLEIFEDEDAQPYVDGRIVRVLVPRG